MYLFCVGVCLVCSHDIVHIVKRRCCCRCHRHRSNFYRCARTEWKHCLRYEIEILIVFLLLFLLRFVLRIAAEYTWLVYGIVFVSHAISCTIDLIVGGTRNWNKNELPRAIHQNNPCNETTTVKHSFERSIDEVSFDHFLSAIQFARPFCFQQKIIEFILQFNVEYKLPFFFYYNLHMNKSNNHSKKTKWALYTHRKREMVEQFCFLFVVPFVCVHFSSLLLFLLLRFAVFYFIFLSPFIWFCADLNPSQFVLCHSIAVVSRSAANTWQKQSTEL